ncbi:hypothetical protein VZT92_024655 [Zoarces viviparus]
MERQTSGLVHSSQRRRSKPGLAAEDVGVTESSARAHLPTYCDSSSAQVGWSPPGGFHRYDQASSRCYQTSETLSSRDH